MSFSIKKYISLISINIFILTSLIFIFDLGSPFIFKKIMSAPDSFGFLPEGLQVLMQSSKNELLPKNYIGILGDSYASGEGDWLIQQRNIDDAKYSSAHLLHDALAIDVISFGRSGAGSIRGILSAPISTLNFLNKTWFYKIPDPEIFLVYFYEGNDLSDNIEYIASSNKCIKKFNFNRKFDQDYFRDYALNMALQSNELYIKSTHFSIVDNFFLSSFLYENFVNKPIEKNFGDYYKCSPYAWFGRTNLDTKNNDNHALINNEIVNIPSRLQAPTTDLSPDEIEFGFYSFEQSLILLHKNFPNSKIGVVYVPSVLSSYYLTGDTVVTQPFIHKDRRNSTPAEIYSKSDAFALRASEISKTHGFSFIDARPFVRSAAKTQLIHGPQDWNHFNKAGYTALAQALITIVTDMLHQSPDESP